MNPDTPLAPESQKYTLLKKLTCGSIIAAGIITIIAFGFPSLFPWMGLNKNLDGLLVALGPVPASPLQVLDSKTGTFSPVTIEVNGVNLPVLDMQEAGNGVRYYIIAEPAPLPKGNLYRENADSSLTPLTTSATAKYNLTYSPESGLLAYESTTIKDDMDYLSKRPWDIQLFNPETGQEVRVAGGNNPHFAQGGQSLFFTSEGSLQVIPVGAPADTGVAVLELGQGSVAISEDATELVAYNPTTRALDRYEILDNASLTYRSSTKTTSVPTAMAFVNGRLLTASAARLDTQFTYYFSDLSGAPFEVAGVPEVVPQRMY